MAIYWIGEKVDTTGAYNSVIEHGELFKRVHDKIDTPLYRFESRFGQTVYISEPYTIGTLEQIINEYSYAELTTFLYETLIMQRGMISFLHSISLHTARERDEGYRAGIERAQKDIREALGLEEDKL
ncbi:hypothetical protein Spock_236 [Bacillus phage Spock]|uniref:Uncharacterized protein n=2 Tax=Bequatrovirus spock TaxID=1918008 RepID=A0A1X9SGA4_9CAUD|nr:hypothetical protein Spock_236 [Bacillus phage Spock]AGY48636.1 hypothetical protein Spock_236 [Bacillus phage Spock]ARQ95153.1 hypothetical protein FLAPJACK_242 [Bacillus phage Flapjack]